MSSSDHQNITPSDFSGLWEWFGPLLARIRHDRQVLQMWLQGYIMGFISKSKSEQVLANEAEGTFLLRFSNQAPGSFAIAYVLEGVVKHYLIKKSDVNVAMSLAVFLQEKPFFATLMQTIPQFTEEWRFQRADKLKVLEKFGLENQNAKKSVKGYEDQLNIPFAKVNLNN